MQYARCLFALSVLASLQQFCQAQHDPPEPASPVQVTLGQSVVALNGPWRFHTGDDPRWADPAFDDSEWETVDLTPPPGAHDPDVGLTGYVPGWQAKGHRGYFGYGWYRIPISVERPPGEALALCGPFYVDSAYQVFLNGRLLGGAGKFSGKSPVAYNMHLPRIFPLSQSFEFLSSENKARALLAVRVWMGPLSLGLPDEGGIHIAPALGTLTGAECLYHLQWSQMIYGYIVDALEGLLFLALAVMTLTLIRFDPSNRAYLWLAAALVLIACARANQAVFFWWQFETVQGFELATVVLFIPLSLAAWTLAWCYWFRLKELNWVPRLVGILTVLYVGSQFVRRSWFYGLFPQWFSPATYFCITAVRLVFVLLTLLIIFRSSAQRGREKWLAVPALLLISVGLFARELSMLHVRGIWFPFGVGVSLTEYVYAIFDVALFALLLYRLFSFARGREKPVYGLA